MKQTLYRNAEELTAHFAGKITAILDDAIQRKGQASILVSGGRTPLPLFKALSQSDIDWSKVVISLADERWVAAEDDASNEKLVRANLLQDKAASATFISMKTAHEDAADAVVELESRYAAMSWPVDVLILGMGEDGHTASLFPCSEQIQEGLKTEAKLLAVQPTTAPHQRMSFSLSALLQSENIFLHLTGESKKAVIEQALAGDNALEMPIRAVIQNSDIELVWAP
ncbi:6-phosphogluconolactonase [Planctobacterium marinum]|uniref:6-phosphogluconolactonase n=1 Tax=Planctobacterium marinum TaxID=1631968 RepID=UPI001E602721|nr:6-phosphogluconolactonase [Planctobacterium marinum]MCC2607269.1 6-phosphogluconolactonase [Planctobacterium marinum]